MHFRLSEQIVGYSENVPTGLPVSPQKSRTRKLPDYSGEMRYAAADAFLTGRIAYERLTPPKKVSATTPESEHLRLFEQKL